MRNKKKPWWHENCDKKYLKKSHTCTYVCVEAEYAVA